MKTKKTGAQFEMVTSQNIILGIIRYGTVLLWKEMLSMANAKKQVKEYDVIKRNISNILHIVTQNNLSYHRKGIDI